MNIFKDYQKTIRGAMQSNEKLKLMASSAGLKDINESFSNGMTGLDIWNYSNREELLPSLNDLAQQLSVKINYDQHLGAHPDFAHLKGTDNTENHYITSVFIDVKGSTRLFAKYRPDVVSVIVNTIQKAAIHISLIFGGYVHRLQGDGLFVYFGGKGLSEKQSVIQALQATSLFTYFMKNDLKEVFEEQGIEKIYTRIGIDLGMDEDVVWLDAGIGNISEVTTSSLHTSLASKMQSHAESNGIVVGSNVKTNVEDSVQELMSSVSKRKEEKDRYVFTNQENGFNYSQFDFDWLKFLKRQSFITSDLHGENLEVKTSPDKTTSNLGSLEAIARKNKPYL